MRQKKRPLGDNGRAGDTLTRRISNTNTDIVPQSPPRDNSQYHNLTQAAAAGDWRLWWRIYCDIHSLPDRPTGRDIKRALEGAS